MEEIRGKHLLLDTNLLIYNVKNEEIFTLLYTLEKILSMLNKFHLEIV
jgi:hypothetical protein